MSILDPMYAVKPLSKKEMEDLRDSGVGVASSIPTRYAPVPTESEPGNIGTVPPPPISILEPNAGTSVPGKMPLYENGTTPGDRNPYTNPVPVPTTNQAKALPPGLELKDDGTTGLSSGGMIILAGAAIVALFIYGR